MRKAQIFLAFTTLFVGTSLSTNSVNRVAKTKCHDVEGDENVYNFSFTDLSGKTNVSLQDFKGKQEPGKNYTEITKGVEHVRPGNGFKPNFMLMQKLEVNGEKENAFFTFLKKHCPETRHQFSNKNDLYYHPFKSNDIRWNWEKFLIDFGGKPYMRYDPSSEPIDVIGPDLEALVLSEHVNSTLTKQ